MSAFLVLFLAALCAPLPQAGAKPEPAPVRPIAGMGFVRTVSRLVYDGRPDEPVELEMLLGFPDRGRFLRTLPEGDPRVRDIEYRSGQQVFLVRSGQASSEEIVGAERDGVFRRFELRRAAFLWPDGFAWQESGDRLRTAPLRRASEDEASALLGMIEARLGLDGRPERLRVLDGAGAELDALAIEAWTEGGDRIWPRRLVASFRGQRIWKEELEHATPCRLLDTSFLPPDRRKLDATGGVRPMDLHPTVQRTVDLSADASWDAARAEYTRLLERAAEELGKDGPALDTAPTFEVSAEGRPLRCVLRLAPGTDVVPQGWTAVPERQGVGLLRLPGLESVGRKELAALAAALPSGAIASTPYVRIVTPPGNPESTSCGLFLPFGPAD